MVSAAVAHLDAHPAALKTPSGTVKPIAKGPGFQPGRASSTEVALRRRSPGASGDLSGLLTVTSSDTASHAQVDKPAPGERRNKTPVYVSGVKKTHSFL